MKNLLDLHSGIKNIFFKFKRSNIVLKDKNQMNAMKGAREAGLEFEQTRKVICRKEKQGKKNKR